MAARACSASPCSASFSMHTRVSFQEDANAVTPLPAERHKRLPVSTGYALFDLHVTFVTTGHHSSRLDSETARQHSQMAQQILFVVDGARGSGPMSPTTFGAAVRSPTTSREKAKPIVQTGSDVLNAWRDCARCGKLFARGIPSRSLQIAAISARFSACSAPFETSRT